MLNRGHRYVGTCIEQILASLSPMKSIRPY